MLLRMPGSFGLFVVIASLGSLAVEAGCSRTNLREVLDSDEAPVICEQDTDCRGDDACKIRVCIYGLCQLDRVVSCNDGNPCTDDSCSPVDGSCSNTWRTPDEDRDGHYAPLSGMTTGSDGACGDDCNDASAAAYPGAPERCDGVDNDCNGIIDDARSYYGPEVGMPAVTRISTTTDNEATPAGIAFDGRKFGMTVVERHERWQGVFHAVLADGTHEVVAEPLTLAANDSVAGPLIWTGSLYGTAWEDRRERSYDIYFNRLDASGKKLQPDLRVTYSDGFSVQPSLVYDGTRWLLAYADDQTTGSFRIYALQISREAQLLSDAVPLTPEDVDARQPRLLLTRNGLGLFYYLPKLNRFEYTQLDSDLNPIGQRVPLQLNEDADASIRWTGDRFLIAWGEKTESSVGPAIWAMSIDEAGNTLEPSRRITSGASMARGPFILSMGDRFVLLWSDDRFTPGSFELSMQTFGNDLRPLDDQQMITALGTDSLDPVAALGGGTLGVAFRTRLNGPWQTYFTALECWELKPR